VGTDISHLDGVPLHTGIHGIKEYCCISLHLYCLHPNV